MADVSRRATHDIDRGWAWIVAFGCFWTMFTVMGLFRSAGVIYVALVGVLGITRESAAWPLSLCGSIMCLIGPIIGMLTHYFSVRLLMMVGTFLTSLGVSLCYFAHTITPIVIFLGAIHGMGIGFALTVVPVVVNSYFVRYRTIAIGITFAGSSAGSFVLPPLTEYLLETYGLRGCFLLLGGVLLHGVVAASLCRPPTYCESKDLMEKSDMNGGTHEQIEVEVKFNNNETETMEKIPIREEPKRSGFKTYLRSATQLYKTPIYFLILLSYSMYFMSLSIYLTVIVDFAEDHSVPANKAAYIISAYSAADLIGRMGAGWIVDLQLFKRKPLVICSFLLKGVALFLMPLAYSYTVIIIIMVFIGVLGGAVMVNFSVLLTEHLGLEKLPMALGLSNCLYGILAFFRPMMIGHYRDVLGSYDYLFFTMGCMQLAGGSIWFIEPIVKACLRKRATSKPIEDLVQQ